MKERNMEREIKMQVVIAWQRFWDGVANGWAYGFGQVIGKAMYWSAIVGIGAFLAQEASRIKARCDACHGNAAKANHDVATIEFFEGRTK